MTRLVNRPVQVTTKNELPRSIIDRDVTHTITEIIDSWTESGAWWNDEASRHVFRVLTTDSSIMDIEQVKDKWFIYRIWD